MITGLSAVQETETSPTASIRELWLEKLQEGKKSTQQIESEMLEGVTEIIEEIQKEAEEKAAQEAQEGKNEEAVTVSVSGSEVEASSDVPETPETSTVEVTA